MGSLGDLRLSVSYVLRATQERAASQTLPPFNYLGRRVERRRPNGTGSGRACAPRLRYFSQGEPDAPEGHALVVTKLEMAATCHVAYIDARANSNANAIARDAADELAPDFDCNHEPEIVGEFEAW